MTQWVSKAVGIDLGTTNSAVAVMNPSDTDTVIHQDPTKAQTTPSAVWRNPRSGDLVVGRKAYARVGSEPEPITSVKRLMGTRRTVSLAGQELTPAQVSAEILREMKRQIEGDVTGFDSAAARWVVDRAVVTVPAYFDQPQIEATREAAELAGLRVVDLLHEPTAAASYHCWRSGVRDGTFLVYDLGGGTFDVSVVRCTAGDFRVLGISGNTMLGGDDIDGALARHLLGLLKEDGWRLDLDVTGDPEDGLRFRRLKSLAEAAKKALTDRTEYMLRDSGTVTDQAGDPVVIDTLIERGELEEVARPIVERTFQYCEEALERAQQEAGVRLADVDKVILAGGSTHLPLVRELVAARLCAATRDSEPVYEKVDTVVALGAAVRAAAVGGLELHDEARTVRVALRGTAVTTSDRAMVGGTVEALDPGVDLAGGYVQLTADDYEDTADLTPGGGFSFRRVPVTPGAQSLLSFDVFDANGGLRASVGRALTHDRAAGPLGSPVTTAICAKPILLEVSRAGRRHRRELIPAMRPLPLKAHFTFSHPGDTDTVEFRLYQQSRQIKVITANVPSSTPAGTDIHVDLEMDANLLITVRGTIGEHPFEGVVELPPERELPGQEQVEELDRGFRDALAYLPAGERNVSHAKMAKARESYESAVAEGDTARAVHEFGQMEEIVTGLGQPAAELEPPKRDFDKLVAQCDEANRYLGGRAGELDVPHDANEMGRAIETQREQGERAFAAGDQRSYGEAVGALHGYLEHLRNLASKALYKDAPVSDLERAVGLLSLVLERIEELRALAAAVGTAEQRATVEDIRRRTADLEPLISRDPQRVQQEAAHELRRLEQLETLLKGRGRGAEGAALPVDRV
ncbi:Hsp70 family protein [Streptomyces litchfieldiae]|uniref:Hsp70 family protein n=1 Tax=Streptomyces litchfieldiae TaxID=3075543 RepID=A0ABU2MKL4_9ACTN|nr:Hsp70 family protein [Streptomyces sp. DSM 44938]MDT0341982.1 Hsp70 family protein [Streptomyces sp. DSM 44938]